MALAAGLLLVAAMGCTATRPLPRAAPAAPIVLEYLGAVAYPANALTPVAGGMRLGSLSGLALDALSGRWIGATDDVQQPRLAWLDVAVASGNPEVALRDFLTLSAAPEPAARVALDRLDMESIVVLPDGSFAVTNEGHTDRDGVARQPALLSISRNGLVSAVAHPPAHYTISRSDTTHGVRHNLGFESLARTPDGRLVTGLEQPLLQDGPVSTAQHGGRVRLLEFVQQGNAWQARREWAYDLDPTPRRAGYGDTCVDGDNGLSELYALDDTRFIALERACLVGAPDQPAFNPVRLYLVDLSGADDVSSHTSLAGREVRAVRKRLLLDLTPLTNRMPPSLATGSNFEGMAAGPPAPDGSPTLLLVSDDNFRATQTLAFVWLKLRRM
jgi:hypothetical protein